MYCNDLNSLIVLSLYEGSILGTVNKLFFSKDLKKLLELEIENEEGVKLSLPTKNIYKIGKNAVIVKNNQSVSIKMDQNNLVQCPVNSKTYSINGEYLGVVKEVVINEKFVTEKISLDNDTILDIEDLASCGKNSVIINSNKSKINLKKFQPIKQPKEFKSAEVTTANIMPIKDEEKIKEKVNTDFLLGRRCVKDIYNFNNELLIKANGLVNKKNLKEIKKFGKLRELMIYSK